MSNTFRGLADLFVRFKSVRGWDSDALDALIERPKAERVRLSVFFWHSQFILNFLNIAPYNFQFDGKIFRQGIA